MCFLKVTGIGKYFFTTTLFKDISFELNSGDVVAITGWNGSGKSTMLRIIAGLVRPSAGQVEMFCDNKPIPKKSRRQYVGMVAPALSLYDELTALENMEFFCRVRGIAYDRKSCFNILERVDLVKNAEKICGTFSSGMKQRLKLVQALIHNPPFLLLDEPGCNLDSKGIKSVKNIISDQRTWGITVIASNEKREVNYADSIIDLSN